MMMAWNSTGIDLGLWEFDDFDDLRVLHFAWWRESIESHDLNVYGVGGLEVFHLYNIKSFLWWLGRLPSKCQF